MYAFLHGFVTVGVAIVSGFILADGNLVAQSLLWHQFARQRVPGGGVGSTSFSFLNRAFAFWCDQSDNVCYSFSFSLLCFLFLFLFLLLYRFCLLFLF